LLDLDFGATSINKPSDTTETVGSSYSTSLGYPIINGTSHKLYVEIESRSEWTRNVFNQSDSLRGMGSGAKYFYQSFFIGADFFNFTEQYGSNDPVYFYTLVPKVGFVCSFDNGLGIKAEYSTLKYQNDNINLTEQRMGLGLIYNFGDKIYRP